MLFKGTGDYNAYTVKCHKILVRVLRKTQALMMPARNLLHQLGHSIVNIRFPYKNNFSYERDSGWWCISCELDLIFRKYLGLSLNVDGNSKLEESISQTHKTNLLPSVI